MNTPDNVERLKSAIDRDDFDEVQRLMTADPSLHRAPMGYGGDGPLTWVAECRIPRRAPSQTRLAIAQWMIENGSDVHQGGDGPLMRACLDDERLPMVDLLVEHGADVNARWHGDYPIACAPCECLAPGILRRLLELGADLTPTEGMYANPSWLLGTYGRDAAGKAACLEVFAEAGYPLADTPAMALHRRRTDLLSAHLARDPSMLSRRFTLAEIYWPEIVDSPQEAITATPVDGTTLLHLAMEFDDVEMARWLLDQGADPNARASIDADGFGGHTPLFHAVVSLGSRGDAKARLLLDRRADPNLRATLRKQLIDMGDPEKGRRVAFRDVTPIGYARAYVEPNWVCEAALALIKERGGSE